jgi:hypothetical protein
MNKKYHPAGKSTREMADRRWRNAVIVGLIVIGIGLIIFFIIFNSKALGLGGGTILILLLAIRLLGDWYEGYDRRSRKMEKRATRGAKAEEAIGAILEVLGPDYFVLHDIESPYGNIDHVVIGRSNGIFLIETKSHHGKVDVADGNVLVNGKPPEKNFIGQVLSNSFWLKGRITEITGAQPWITPILVFTNAFVPHGKSIKNVRIINKRYLDGAIKQKSREGEGHTRIWEMREAVEKTLMQRNG